MTKQIWLESRFWCGGINNARGEETGGWQSISNGNWHSRSKLSGGSQCIGELLGCVLTVIHGYAGHPASDREYRLAK